MLRLAATLEAMQASNSYEKGFNRIRAAGRATAGVIAAAPEQALRARAITADRRKPSRRRIIRNRQRSEMGRRKETRPCEGNSSRYRTTMPEKLHK